MRKALIVFILALSCCLSVYAVGNSSNSAKLEIQPKIGWAVPFGLFAGIYPINFGSPGATVQANYYFMKNIGVGISVGGISSYESYEEEIIPRWSIPLGLVAVFKIASFSPFLGLGTDILAERPFDSEHFWNVYVTYGFDFSIPFSRSLDLSLGLTGKNIIALWELSDSVFDGAPVHAMTMVLMPTIGLNIKL